MSWVLHIRAWLLWPLSRRDYGYWTSLPPHRRIGLDACGRRRRAEGRRRDGDGASLLRGGDADGSLAEDALSHALHVVHRRAHGIGHLLLRRRDKVGIIGQGGQTAFDKRLGEEKSVGQNNVEEFVFWWRDLPLRGMNVFLLLKIRTNKWM